MRSYLINTYRLGFLMPFNGTFITNDFSKSDMYMFIYLFIELFKNVLIWRIKDIPKGQLALLATVERQQ